MRHREAPEPLLAGTSGRSRGVGLDADVLLGTIIKSLRLARSLSQAELGQRIGVSFQQVQKYERGSNRVSASTLMLMANAFGVSASEILQACECRSQPSGKSLVLSDPLEQELLTSFRNIASSGRRRAIVGLVNAIADSGP